jgi:hypothetical protein
LSPRVRRRATALLTAAVLSAGIGAALAPVAAAAWGRPFQFAKPGALDHLGPELTFSSGGAAAAAFGIADIDAPGVSQAFLTTRSAQGAMSSPRAIAGAQQILALAYDGGSLELLTGSSPPGLDCCSSAQAVAIGAGGRPGAPRTVVGGLTGATDGRLLTLADGQMLAVVATERGVWAAQSTRADRFGAAHLLTGAGQMPQSIDAAWLGGENTIVAWTAATGPAGAAVARGIEVSGGTRLSPPHRALNLLTVPAGHSIDELTVAREGAGATAAWIESWYDAHGAYHSQVEAADLTAHPVAHPVSPGAALASGLSFAADASGDQALAWESCTLQDVCQAQAALRSATTSFSGPRTLGAIDPAQQPAVAVGPHGQVLVGWVRGGQPVAAVAPRTGSGAGFGSPATLSTSTYALNVTVAFGPRRQALAAWSQGTLAPSIVGAAYTLP